MADNSKVSLYLVISVAIVLLALVFLKPGYRPEDQSAPVAQPESESGAKLIPLLIGTSTPAKPKSEKDSRGLYAINFNTETRELGKVWHVANGQNPSFIARSRKGLFYSVFEAGQGQGTVNVFSWDKNNQLLAARSSVPSAGASPCYVSLSPDESYLAVANYMSGNAAVYKLDEKSGAAQINTQQLVQHEGSGPNASRQEAAHAHWVQWNPAGDRMYVVDLGIDKVMSYRFDKINGKLSEAEIAYTAEPGAGPRHMVFHPSLPMAYLLNELSSSVSQLKINRDGSLSKVKTLSILPEDYSGPNQSAHIAISKDGKNLYASNRGHNSIAVLALAADGGMKIRQHVASGGNWPRYFVLLEKYKSLIVANKRSNNLSVLELLDDIIICHRDVAA